MREPAEPEARSAHGEEPLPTVHHGRSPGMLYDYYGFPDETYRLSWPAPGAPEVARRVDELLESAGFTVGREEKRGYDHGTFVPLMVAAGAAGRELGRRDFSGEIMGVAVSGFSFGTAN